MPASKLPIHAVADSILEGVASAGEVILSAPTGSGKSTQVPQLLVDAATVEGLIIVLQPRRLAARMLAQRVAYERGEGVGESVGYRIRFEDRTSARTRIIFVTEAVLLRRVLQDPELKGVGAVVFDEFHERNLYSDLSLSAVLNSRAKHRPDLKLVVMSATLEVAALRAAMPRAKIVPAEGRMYPLTIEYTGAALGHQSAPVWERAVAALKRWLASVGSIDANEAGHVLIFMPGAYEINRTLRLLEGAPFAKGFSLHALHGSLPPNEQDAAVAPSARAKIIVSTNVAETSLTIDGVRVVIDGGLARVARFDARRGVNALLVEPISRAAAEQRAGRAGRTGPGQVYRLWSEAEHRARAEAETPEVKRVDLAEACLLLSVAGWDVLDSFPWFEPPVEEALKGAFNVLRRLGALDADHRVTEMGRTMARLPQHPRFARFLLEADRTGCLQEAACVAALMEGAAVYRATDKPFERRLQEKEIETDDVDCSDLLIQLKALDLARAAKFDRGWCMDRGIHAQRARLAWQAVSQLLGTLAREGFPVRDLGDASGADGLSLSDRLGNALVAGFSDFIGVRLERGTRRVRLAGGRVGELRRESVVETALLLACEREEREVRGDIVLLLGMVHPVRLEALKAQFPEAFCDAVTQRYDPDLRKVVSVRERRFGDLVLECKEVDDAGLAERGGAARLLAEEVLAGRLNLKQWNQAVDDWVARVNFVAMHCPEAEILPLDEEVKRLLLEQVCEGAVSYKEIKDRPVMPVLKEWVSPEQMYYLDTWAPCEIELPRKKKPARIVYDREGKARIAATVQELYDVKGAKLRVANGRVGLLVEVLAPNRKMVQLTDDMDGFWERTYSSVRKELAGRYPKHEWR